VNFLVSILVYRLQVLLITALADSVLHKVAKNISFDDNITGFLLTFFFCCTGVVCIIYVVFKYWLLRNTVTLNYCVTTSPFCFKKIKEN